MFKNCFHRSAILAALILALFAPGVFAQLPVVELSAGMYRIEAELAHTPEARQTGLMHRRSMLDNRGMIFVFTQDARHCMWMRNTFIPLSVAFLDVEGRILNIEDMTPQTEVSHCAVFPARFALEMNKSWFAARGLGAGMRIRGVETLPAGF
jgi:uncharacterized membrane protein (UPF0127 family)